MRYLLLFTFALLAHIPAADLTSEKIDSLRDGILQHLGDAWECKAETRYSTQDIYTNDRGHAVEKILKPGMLKISGIGALDMAITTKDKNDISMITIKIFEFSENGAATAFFNDKYIANPDFSSDSQGYYISATSGKYVFLSDTLTVAVSTVSTELNVCKDVSKHLKLMLE